MSPSQYNEDTLVQKIIAEHLEKQLQQSLNTLFAESA